MKNSKQNQVGNFEKLVSFVNAQGAVYNPSKASISGAALQTLLTQSQGAIKAADVSHNAYDQAINARQQVIKSLPPTAARIVAFLKVIGASPEVIDECSAIKRRMYGQPSKTENKSPATPSATADQPAEKNTRSVSYRDVESMITQFERLVSKASAEPLYKPNEKDLQAASLTALVSSARDHNKAVKLAFAAMSEANIALDKMLHGKNSIHEQSLAVKNYVRVIYGYDSAQHDLVRQIKFTNA
jgi:hypothetical protein